LPPLRERTDDIPLLIEHLLARLPSNRGADGEPRMVDLTPEALAQLTAHRWPGNVRELLNVIEHAVSLGDGPVLAAHDLPEAIRHPGRDPRNAAPRRAHGEP